MERKMFKTISNKLIQVLDECMSDVTFVIGEEKKEFRAMRRLVAAHSTPLEKLFEKTTKSNKQESKFLFPQIGVHVL